MLRCPIFTQDRAILQCRLSVYDYESIETLAKLPTSFDIAAKRSRNTGILAGNGDGHGVEGNC